MHKHHKDIEGEPIVLEPVVYVLGQFCVLLFVQNYHDEVVMFWHQTDEFFCER